MLQKESVRKTAAAVLLRIAAPFIRLKLNYSCDAFSSVKGPFLLLCNHTTDLDPLLLGIAGGSRLRFVASEHILRKGLGTSFLMTFFAPIVHTKGKTGLQSTMEILRALRKGDTVGMFPEGNRSFNGTGCRIPDVTGKLVKSSGVPLVTYRIEGGYFTMPRWGKSMRRGRMRGHLVKVYSVEELKTMSAQEVTDSIRADLYEDAYASQKADPCLFRGDKLAEGLEAALFICPACGGIGTLHTENDRIYCSCGYYADMDGFGTLHGSDGKERTVTAWDLWQRSRLKERLERAGENDRLFFDKIRVRRIGKDHDAEKPLEKCMTAFKDRFTFDGGERLFDKIDGMAVRSRNTLNLFLKGDDAQYEITGDEHFCALKYLYLLRLARGEVLF